MVANRRIKVAYLIDTLERAGAEKQLLTVATHLDRERFEPVVLCLARTGPFEAELRRAGVPVVLIGKRHKLAIGALRRLRAWLRAERPEVLHTWMFTCNLFGRLAARGLPVRTLATEVAADVGKAAWRLRVDRWLAPATDAFYVNSATVAAFYRERCGIPPERVTVIPNGVRVEAVEPLERAALGVPDGAFVVCCAGRLSPEKGFDRVIEALAGEPLRGRVVYLVVAGEGPLREGLAAHAARLGVGDRVRLLGYRDDLQQVIRAADAFVLASLHEGMPNALMEALAQGRPCVATAVGGVRELMVDGESGLVIGESDPRLIAEAIARLMDAPELAARLGRAARDRMATRFSIEENVRRFEALYESLAEGRAKVEMAG